MDFNRAIEQLLALEEQPARQDDLAEILVREERLLSTLKRKQDDVSIQVEEIYDLVRELASENAAFRGLYQAEQERVRQFIQAVMSLNDQLDDFHAFAIQSGDDSLSHQAEIMRKQAAAALERCAMTRLGQPGQLLDPTIHSVQGMRSIPGEYVTQVLQSGYRYQSTVLRKAAVLIGQEERRE